MSYGKVSRPFLLAGLIISLVCFCLLTISSIVGIYATLIVDVASGDDPVMAMTVVILAISFVLVLIFSILGIVFSAISLSRCRLSPQEFDRKRGMVTTTIVFSIIVAILEIVGLFTEFNIFNLIFSIVLVVAIVFMFIDRSKNKKLLRMGDNDFSEINYESVSSTKNFNKNDE